MPIAPENSATSKRFKPLPGETSGFFDAAQGGETQNKMCEEGIISLKKALAPVEIELTKLAELLPTFLPILSQSSSEISKYVFAKPGKMIRPALYFFSAHLFQKQGSHHFPIGAVCEFVHTASLLHDDVVDNSTLRRNKKTSNAIWGDQCSVLVGDLAYSRASEMMAESGSLKLVARFAKAIRCMSEGELLQLEAAFNFEKSEDHYHKIIHYKTAELISASCQAAAYLADADESQEIALGEFGYHLGTAFQLVDDALDYLGHRELFGKATLSDLKEGKITKPVLLLKDYASTEELEKVKEICGLKNLDAKSLEFIQSLVEKYQTAIKTIEFASKHTELASASLSIFEDSSWKQHMLELADSLVWRTY